jgi:hypothetical protein
MWIGPAPAFMIPNDDVGYVRLNLAANAMELSIRRQIHSWKIAETRTFRNADGNPAIRRIDRVSEFGFQGPCVDQLPDLIIYWSDRVVSPLARVSSPQFGEVSSPGWGTGRTGCHTGDAWALLLPGSSQLRAPTAPHIIDVPPPFVPSLS